MKLAAQCGIHKLDEENYKIYGKYLAYPRKGDTPGISQMNF